jgi:hypothetical protein
MYRLFSCGRFGDERASEVVFEESLKPVSAQE